MILATGQPINLVGIWPSQDGQRVYMIIKSYYILLLYPDSLSILQQDTVTLIFS